MASNLPIVRQIAWISLSISVCLLATLTSTGLSGCRTAPAPPPGGEFPWRRVAHDVLPRVSQPDVHKWRAIRLGMTEAEVRAILGKPLNTTPRPPDDTEPNVFTLYWWNFGELTFRSYATQGGCGYYIHFHQGHVHGITDPWNGKLSEDGLPTVPELLFPESDRTFSHYPRFLDFRWHPASGIYPMDYEVVIQSLSINHYEAEHFEDYVRRVVEANRMSQPPPGWSEKDMEDAEKSFEDHLRTEGGVQLTFRYRTHDVYLPFEWVGANTGRWRVRAVNAKGASDWTDWRYFECSK